MCDSESETYILLKEKIMANAKKSLTKRVVHLDLPVKIWKRFLHWCVEQGHSSLTAGIKELIREKVK